MEKAMTQSTTTAWMHGMSAFSTVPVPFAVGVAARRAPGSELAPARTQPQEGNPATVGVLVPHTGVPWPRKDPVRWRFLRVAAHLLAVPSAAATWTDWCVCCMMYGVHQTAWSSWRIIFSLFLTHLHHQLIRHVSGGSGHCKPPARTHTHALSLSLSLSLSNIHQHVQTTRIPSAYGYVDTHKHKNVQ